VNDVGGVNTVIIFPALANFLFGYLIQRRTAILDLM